MYCHTTGSVGVVASIRSLLCVVCSTVAQKCVRLSSFFATDCTVLISPYDVLPFIWALVRFRHTTYRCNYFRLFYAEIFILNSLVAVFSLIKPLLALHLRTEISHKAVRKMQCFKINHIHVQPCLKCVHLFFSTSCAIKNRIMFGEVGPVCAASHGADRDVVSSVVTYRGAHIRPCSAPVCFPCGLRRSPRSRPEGPPGF